MTIIPKCRLDASVQDAMKVFRTKNLFIYIWFSVLVCNYLFLPNQMPSFIQHIINLKLFFALDDLIETASKAVRG